MVYCPLPEKQAMVMAPPAMEIFGIRIIKSIFTGTTIGLIGTCVACVLRGWILNVQLYSCFEHPPSSLPELTPNGFQCEGQCHNRCNSVLFAV